MSMHRLIRVAVSVVVVAVTGVAGAAAPEPDYRGRAIGTTSTAPAL